MLMKKIYVYRKQFPLILAFAVTEHKYQGLSLDCALMDLSEQVFCAGMAYMALSRVKQLENLHLIAFNEEAIQVTGKCLHEINRLRQMYRPDLPQYTVPREKKSGTRRPRKRKMVGTVNNDPPSPKKPKTDESPPEIKADLVYRNVGRRLFRRQQYNPVSEDWQRRTCQELGLRFVKANGSRSGGPDVVLRRPSHGKSVPGDGNCLFRSLSYATETAFRNPLPRPPAHEITEAAWSPPKFGDRYFRNERGRAYCIL